MANHLKSDFEGACVECHANGSIKCDGLNDGVAQSLKRIDMKSYQREPNRFELRNGSTDDAPNCHYGNKY